MKKLYTICVVRDEGRILLGYKKTKLGQGYWNGFGGKVEAGETPPAAAKREVAEECGLQIATCDPIGVMTYTYDHDPAQREVHFFIGEKYQGVPRETREMVPRWFALDEIPYKEMWPDSQHWLPLLIARQYFEGNAHYRTYQDLVECVLNRIAQQGKSRHIATIS